MNTKNGVSFVVCVIFLSALLLSVSAEAQQPRVVKARENFITLWLLKMTQVLNLSEEQTARIYPAVHRTEKEKRMLHREAAKKIRELKLTLRKDNPDDGVLVGLIEDIKKLRNQVESKDEELESFIEKSLTVEQRAKYIVFATEFMRGMRDKLNRRMNRRRIPE